MRSDFAPVGRLLGTFEQLHAAGCIQAGADFEKLEEAKEHLGQLFVGLQVMTDGNLCDGCPRFDNGSCKAFKQWHSSRQAFNKVPSVQAQPAGKGIKAVAKELGISINEAQRRRVRGEL